MSCYSLGSVDKCGYDVGWPVGEYVTREPLAIFKVYPARQRTSNWKIRGKKTARLIIERGGMSAGGGGGTGQYKEVAVSRQICRLSLPASSSSPEMLCDQFVQRVSSTGKRLRNSREDSRGSREIQKVKKGNDVCEAEAIDLCGS